MFRITEDPSSGSLVQCLTKNILTRCACVYTQCCRNTDIVHVNGHNRITLVIFSPTLGSLMMDPL